MTYRLVKVRAWSARLDAVFEHPRIWLVILDKEGVPLPGGAIHGEQLLVLPPSRFGIQ